MAWAVWLSGPVVVTVLVSLWAWWRGRPRRQPSTAEAMQAHTEYLDALVATARSRDRGLRSPEAGAHEAAAPGAD